MIEWFSGHPLATGVATLFLMWSDWLLTILQERERQLHYGEHYTSYPVNTIEGNRLYQSVVPKTRIVEPRHIIPAIVLSAIVAFVISWIPQNVCPLVIGYVWGLYLIVDTTHLGNFLGYRASRRGFHGRIFLHQRTGFLIQMGRYLALSMFLILLAVCSASLFIVGVAIAGVSSAARQFVGLRRVPRIDAEDMPPAAGPHPRP